MEKMSMEQQFEVAKFKAQIETLGLEACRELLLNLFINDIRKTNAFIELTQHHWFAPKPDN